MTARSHPNQGLQLSVYAQETRNGAAEVVAVLQRRALQNPLLLNRHKLEPFTSSQDHGQQQPTLDTRENSEEEAGRLHRPQTVDRSVWMFFVDRLGPSLGSISCCRGWATTLGFRLRHVANLLGRSVRSFWFRVVSGLLWPLILHLHIRNYCWRQHMSKENTISVYTCV